MPPPPHRARMGMMGGGGGPRGYMRKPSYMSESYMSSPYMRGGSARGVGMMRPRMHPSAAAGGMPRDLGNAYSQESVGRRGDMMAGSAPNPYMMRDREALAPPSAYPASSYANSASSRYG